MSSTSPVVGAPLRSSTAPCRRVLVAGAGAAMLVATQTPALADDIVLEARPEVTAPLAAAVAPAPSPYASRAIRVDVGLGSAVGVIGGVLSLPSWRNLRTELGLGWGISGVQLSAFARWTLGDGTSRFAPGGGLSVGLPIGTAFNDGRHNGSEPIGDNITMAWLDLDLVALEYRAAGGLVLFAGAGITIPLTEGHYDFGDVGDTVGRGSLIAQARTGIGRTF